MMTKYTWVLNSQTPDSFDEKKELLYILYPNMFSYSEKTTSQITSSYFFLEYNIYFVLPITINIEKATFNPSILT